jgi:hypothetical protein
MCRGISKTEFDLYGVVSKSSQLLTHRAGTAKGKYFAHSGNPHDEVAVLPLLQSGSCVSSGLEAVWGGRISGPGQRLDFDHLNILHRRVFLLSNEHQNTNERENSQREA